VTDPDGSAASNGLSAVTAFFDSNRRITHVYAGDVLGNLWKFDLSSSNTNQWSSSLLFKARNSGARQPITAKVRVMPHPISGRLVIFGTGQYLVASDKTNTGLQTLYGIWDRGLSGTSNTVAKSKLLQQTFLNETVANDREYRVLSQEPIDWDLNHGWYVNLRLEGGVLDGERVIATPSLSKERVLFTTFIPRSDPCLSGGESWVLGMDALSGGRLNGSLFDVNNDKYFDTEDVVSCGSASCAPSGFKIGGSVGAPGNLYGDGGDSGISSNVDGGIDQWDMAGSGSRPGRMSWRQLK
jgi:type IV pilus assembly protein PilY1